MTIIKKFIAPLGILAVIFIIFVTIYVSTQQLYRLTADDPQTQIAEDMSVKLDAGTPINYWSNNVTVDIANSLSPFYAIVDNNKRPIINQAVLDKQATLPPTGTLDIKDGETHKFTWQPKSGVRIATVVVKYKDGYVISGRSLREVEKRISQNGKLILTAWLITSLTAGVTLFLNGKEA